MFTLDDTDLEIMRATQAGLPLTALPYHDIAVRLALTADEVMSRMTRMQEHGIIRRIGAIPNHYRLGYRYNGMTVWNVPDEKVDELGQQVGRLDFVSHCYRRPRHLPLWPYNLFAMVHGKSQDAVDKQIQVIAMTLGVYNRGSEVLYSTKILKKTGFRSQPGDNSALMAQEVTPESNCFRRLDRSLTQTYSQSERENKESLSDLHAVKD